MSDKVFVGQNMAQLDTSPPLEAVSKVVLMVDADNAYVAGTDTGRTIEVTCPYGTQAMANNILTALQSYTYTPAQAQDALLDPAAEMGDGLTLGGVYTVLAQADTQWDAMMASDAGAPGQAEQESEYSYQSPLVGELRYQIAETRSLISKTSEEIRLEVSDLGDQVSSISTKLDSITLTVQNGSTSSSISLSVGGVVVSSQNIQMNGLVTFTGLANGTTTIDGACIKTGTIDADRLNLTGAITFGDLSSSVRNDIDDAYSMASKAQSTANDAYDTVDKWTYGSTTYIDGAQIMTGTVSASTLEGGEIYLLDGSGRRAGSFTLEGASSYNGRAVTIMSGAISLNAQYGDLYMESGDGAAMQASSYFRFSGDVTPYTSSNYSLGRSTRTWSDVYADNGEIQTSDQNQKNSIEPLPDKYVSMLDNVTPVRYKLNDGTSGRYHVGFIAQDVEQAMESAGVSDLEFGGWIKDVDEDGNPVYMLRYTEMIAILWAKIKQLEGKING